MALEIIHKLNWVDLVIGIVLVRAIYIGLKRGFVDEVFHLIAVVATIFITFHYYPELSRFLEGRAFFKSAMANTIAYLFLWGIVSLIAKLVRDGIRILFKIETKSLINKTGGLIVALCRAALTCSLVVWFLFITTNEYAGRTANASFSGKRFAQVGSVTYKKIFTGLVEKYFPSEIINQDVILSRRDSLRQKN
ncbi:MAG: CvpA family protein [Candidatus Aceula meridiana]|nr:CvpA family protein [Candidatus Aceula meridiana]